MAKQNLLNNKIIEVCNSLAIVISAPSGTGKTTIIKKLLLEYENLKLSVSTTTRFPRSGEVEGEDYFFLSTSSFQSKIQENSFLEYDLIYDNFYGTSKSQLLQAFSQKKDIIFDVSWYGASQIKTNTDAILIYLLPPSLKQLKLRLLSRAKDDLQIINTRIHEVKKEIQYAQYYDYVLINNNLDDTINVIKNIIDIEKTKRDKKSELINSLYQEQL